MLNANDKAARFLGFAFASADLLFEIDRSGQIVFALGARRQLTGDLNPNLIGQSWKAIVAPIDHEFMQTLLRQLDKPGRCGPVRLTLRSDSDQPRHASFSACKLDISADHIHCVLSLSGGGAFGAVEADGIMTHENFVRAAPEIVSRAFDSGVELILELIDLEASRGNSADDDGVMNSLSAMLRSEAYGGSAVARLSPGQFALLRKTDATGGFESRLSTFADEHGMEPLKSASVAIDAQQPPISMLRAIRATLDTVLTEGLSDEGGANPAAKFAGAMEGIIKRGEMFQARVATRDFHLVFQPVIRLESQSISHFETLARFEGDKSPAESIRLAEELDLMGEFDLAVTDMVLGRLSKDESGLMLALNLSARSVSRPAFMKALMERLERVGMDVITRLIVEVTETARVEDIAQVNAHIQRIRKRGTQVCLDDFGVGEASIRYLRELDVDGIKFDGCFCTDLLNSRRDQALMRHLAALCKDLQIKTVAEMIETDPVAKMVQSLGVDLGQGWHFGQPQKTMTSLLPQASVGKRSGEKVSWG